MKGHKNMYTFVKHSYIFFLICLFGCGWLTANYSLSLQKIEYPVDISQEYSDKGVVLAESDNYEDDLINIVFIPGPKDIFFTIENKTNHSMKIIWDDAVYIDVENTSHPVIHTGIKYIDKTESQVPSVVPPKGVLEDIIVPADNIVYNQESGWIEKSILPTIVPRKRKNVFKQTIKGKTFRILLPIEIKGIVNEYIFTFEVNDVDIAGSPSKNSNFRW